VPLQATNSNIPPAACACATRRSNCNALSIPRRALRTTLLRSRFSAVNSQEKLEDSCTVGLRNEHYLHLNASLSRGGNSILFDDQTLRHANSCPPARRVLRNKSCMHSQHLQADPANLSRKRDSNSSFFEPTVHRGHLIIQADTAVISPSTNVSQHYRLVFARVWHQVDFSLYREPLCERELERNQHSQRLCAVKWLSDATQHSAGGRFLLCKTYERTCTPRLPCLFQCTV
jgi:hypothetical protein